ncbi:MAG: hypothetical protein M1828_005460 [Chrysothrix sp. TS-e1954]|nr:MAG: hypothetical protein M1828_005460 [Chrysothrix sp. TS-e1954]
MPSRSNLTFEAQEPGFLQKLRAQAGGRDPDRHERQIARPQRAQIAKGDDEPTLVDDEDTALSKEEYEALKAGKEVERDQRQESTQKTTQNQEAVMVSSKPDQTQDIVKTKQGTAKVGLAQKKRKVQKLSTAEEEDNVVLREKKPSKKPRKKATAVGLSFETADDGVG